MKNLSMPQRPPMPTSQDEKRVIHSSLRKRLIMGTWGNDLENTLYDHISADRREAWGPSDMSSNPFEQITRQLAVLYDQAPFISNSTGDITGLIGRNGYILRAGLFQLMQRAQQYILGMREAVLRIDIVYENEKKSSFHNELCYRLVTSDMVYCESSPDIPDRPLLYVEHRLRYDEFTKKLVWTADLLDIRDTENPKYGVFLLESNGELGRDVSKQYLGRPIMIGDDYPFRDKDNNPFLPLVLYHAEKTGQLWDPYFQISTVEGTLLSAVYFTMYSHVMKSASWPQRYIAGLSIAGMSQLDQDNPARRAAISTDPASVLVFYAEDGGGQPLVGQFSAPYSPTEMLEACAKFEYRIATSSGISPADLQKTSGDPRSGYALQVSRVAQREAQRKMAPVARLYDEELIAKTAILCNRFFGTSFPESAYRITYRSLPRTPEEMKAIREDVLSKLDAGLISPVEAVVELYDDMSEEDARLYLQKIRIEKAQFNL